MKNDMKRAAKREARVWAVAVILAGLYLTGAWLL